jgi:hypothetical protein
VPRGFRLPLALILAIFATSQTRADDPPAVPEALKPPSYDDFLVIPLRVHILSSSDLLDVNCGLTDADLARILGKVNGIWKQAGVYWAVDPLVREAAAKQERFKMTMEAKPADPLNAFRMLAPEESKADDGMNVYYIHKFSVNGVYLGNRMAFVQETAKLRPVPGGIDEPLPRVTAHELGHALGLPHRQDRTNLLASGNNGTTLNEAEVARSRKRAESMPGSLNVPDLRKKVEELLAKGETSEARKLLAWLAEVPGRGADEAREKLDALPAGIEKKEDAKPASP